MVLVRESAEACFGERDRKRGKPICGARGGKYRSHGRTSEGQVQFANFGAGRRSKSQCPEFANSSNREPRSGKSRSSVFQACGKRTQCCAARLGASAFHRRGSKETVYRQDAFSSSRGEPEVGIGQRRGCGARAQQRRRYEQRFHEGKPAF